MSPKALEQPTAAILAGGRGSRLGGSLKALAPLAGRPLIEHVRERLSGQVGRVLISVQQTDPGLANFGEEQVLDVVQRHRGPLTGLCSALLRLQCRGWGGKLLLCPCDAPFLPADLAARLSRAASERGLPVAVARYQGALQPVFSLWDLAALDAVREAVMEQGQGGLMRLLDAVDHAAVDWPEQQPNPFFNVNTPADLAEAERLAGDHCES